MIAQKIEKVNAWQSWICFAMVLATLLVLGSFVGEMLLHYIQAAGSPEGIQNKSNVIVFILVIFIIASATPFVPGAEIGFGLLMVFGGKVAVLVYTAMIVSLSISFLVGRFVPISKLHDLFALLNMTSSQNFITQIQPMDVEDRLAFFTDKIPYQYFPWILRNRYLALIVLINTPGNSLIGGGGGIAFVAGLSGVFSISGFLVSLSIAIAPIPLFMFFAY